MIKLFLDDTRDPWDDTWVVVRNYKEFVEFLEENGPPDVVSFDHDLHFEHYPKKPYPSEEEYNKLYKNFKFNTGKECAEWMCNYCVEGGYSLPICFVHSMNPPGARNISSIIKQYALFYYGEDIDVPLQPYSQIDPTWNIKK